MFQICYSPIFPYICAEINIDHVVKDGVRSVTLNFEKDLSGDLDIYFMQKDVQTSRFLRKYSLKSNFCTLSCFSNFYNYMGDNIFFPEKKNVGKIMNIRFSIENYDEQLEKSNCVKYPTNGYQSFGDCDDAFIRLKPRDTFASKMIQILIQGSIMQNTT